MPLRHDEDEDVGREQQRPPFDLAAAGNAIAPQSGSIDVKTFQPKAVQAEMNAAVLELRAAPKWHE
jgi:hypothetical protein